MFFVISWRCVVNVVADIRMMSTTVTILTVAVLGACTKVVGQLRTEDRRLLGLRRELAG